MRSQGARRLCLHLTATIEPAHSKAFKEGASRHCRYTLESNDRLEEHMMAQRAIIRLVDDRGPRMGEG
jgi:hypothetical protein